MTESRPPPDRTDVALALVQRDGRWLVARRAPGRVLAGLWEFPGGTMHPAESPASAAVRETREETGLEVRPVGLLGRIVTAHAGGRIVLHLVRCEVVAGEARAACPAVTEVGWAGLDELRGLAMPPANGEIIERLAALTR